MAFRREPGLSDMQLIEALDLIECHGWTATRVAERFGVTRNVIIGSRHRVRLDLDRSEAAPGPRASKPENMDGGMPHGWWRKRAKVGA